jgi:formylmethanofuran dehydrogenase subunit E
VVRGILDAVRQAARKKVLVLPHAIKVCAQCGEPLFETREVDLIQQALVALDRESQKLVGAS